MPTFDTPQPPTVTVDLAAGHVWLTATDRADTVVEVRPSNAAVDTDVRAAEQTHVEYADGNLLVRGPRPRTLGLFGRVGSVDVTIALPSDAAVRGTASAGTFQGTGRLGGCRLRTSAGDLRLERTGDLELDTSAGAVTVEQVTGHARISTGSGDVRLGEVTGDAVVKNSNGDSHLGAVDGEARVTSANGDIVLTRAGGPVEATTANGDIRIGEVAGRSVSVRTGCGGIDVGVRDGTPALLDLHTGYGNVDNQLRPCDEPDRPDEAVRLTARTSSGDIVVRRR
ncbi:DUF4097 family beta strand repeat-containing protein [Micromonospora sp. WMMD882]|uniref:DUF4097 family beta strand repeat-containing protein n=1 Tax=Micromonospora sp. WMMD882 TaxID=3015151 RepID=UPI00248C84DA|nr:DUF4097 family beta strand repeat-containing protein [Micromonospora sp. WMMD882]WBB79956.1 DUF4097 family beta strand repeat-containing protein [Micromonospora sp. WMMD882]